MPPAHPTIVARLLCDEPTAKRIAAVVAEALEDAVAGAFEAVDGAWAAELHFSTPPDQQAVRAIVAGAAGETAVAALQFETVAERDWVAASLAGLTPIRAGRFIVQGAHDRARIAANAIGIEIEAALAFGTGHHGTTRGCLLALDALARCGRVRRVFDVGTGSGVLAIAAARTCHAPVIATDIDPVAVTAARSNARLNRAGALVTILRADGTRGNSSSHLHGSFDLIFANILIGPLVRMASSLARLAAPGGTVVLSGLLPSQANAATAAYRMQGVVLERRIFLDGWATLVMRRPNRKPPRPRPRRFA